MKKITGILYFSIFFFAVTFPAFAQESAPVEEKKTETKIESGNNETTKPQSTPESKEEKRPKAENRTNEQKSKTTTGKESGKKEDGPILKYPGLAEEFKTSYEEHDPVSHTMINFMYGLVSGGLIGLGGGLSFYTSDTDLTPLYISAIATGGVGGITGIIIALIENGKATPYVIGMPVFQYSWYGAFAGALTGTLIGLIPFATNDSVPDLLNWIGYGTFAGLATGITLYFLIPQKSHKNIIVDSNPLETKIGYKFLF